MRDGCRENGCALLGGELAEMPGFYQPGDFELVGFIVGMVDRPLILDGSRVRAGDVLVGLRSVGLHTNGYSLARTDPVRSPPARARRSSLPGTDLRVGEALLAPHRSYLRALEPILAHPGLHALAHITGGGLTDNLPRVLPDGTHGRIRARELGDARRSSARCGELGAVELDEMLRVFNMGIGMVVVVDPAALDELSRDASLDRRRCPGRDRLGRVRAAPASSTHERARGRAARVGILLSGAAPTSARCTRRWPRARCRPRSRWW